MIVDEWIVIRLDRTLEGGFERHREGNRAKFDLDTARQLLLKMGAGWRMVHAKTMVEPKDHQDWLRLQDARHGAGTAAKVLANTPER